MGKSALSSSSPRAEEQGRGTALAGGARAAALVFGSGQEEGEKRKGDPRGRFPPSILGKEACRAGFHGGGRQQAAAAMVAPLRGSMAGRS